jgi:hypothetical protein
MSGSVLDVPRHEALLGQTKPNCKRNRKILLDSMDKRMGYEAVMSVAIGRGASALFKQTKTQISSPSASRCTATVKRFKESDMLNEFS